MRPSILWSGLTNMGKGACSHPNKDNESMLTSTIISPSEQKYHPTVSLQGHTDWVRDVAWAPTILQKSYIASASQDKTVKIWTSDPAHPNDWKPTTLEFDAVLWRVSWSLSGNVLAVSGGDNKVSLWKENLRGEWDCVKWIEE